MTRFWTLAAALLVMQFAMVTAQTPGVPAALLTDGTDDVQILAPTGAVADPTAGLDALDLKSLTATESPIDIVFALQVASLEGNDAHQGQVVFNVYFRHNDKLFAVEMNSFLSPGTSGSAATWDAALQGLDEGSGFYRDIVGLPAEVTVDTVTVRVPREYLVDASGSTPFPGRVLDAFWATSQVLGDASINLGSGTPRVSLPDARDRMPDTGEGLVPLPIVYGVAQTGHARLMSPEPFRSSNGEATTFVFKINATNHGDKDDVFEFTAQGQPAAWDVRVPSLLRIAAGQTLEIPIPVRTAFAHDHGSVTQFTLEMASRADPDSVGRVVLGLRYPAIPQPAGHHNELFLHSIDFTDDPMGLALATAFYALGSGGSGQYSYINAVDAAGDERDEQAVHRGTYCELNALSDNDTVGSGYCWNLPLDPGLEMGIDFDLLGTGAYSIPIGSLFPQVGARVQGQILRFPPPDPNDPFRGAFTEPIVLAELLPSARFDLLPNTEHLFEGVIQPTIEGDFVPYERGASLSLSLRLLTNRPDNFYFGPKTEPNLMPGGHFTLPLTEYEDRIDEAFSATDLAVLSILGDGHRMTNPGKTLVFDVTLTNADQQTHDFDLALVGSNLEWARILGPQRITLGAGDESNIRVAIAIPDSAVDGDRADLILEAASREVFEARALTRLVGTADTDAEHADEAHLAIEDAAAKKSPAVGLEALMLGLVGLAIVLRRRTRQD